MWGGKCRSICRIWKPGCGSQAIAHSKPRSMFQRSGTYSRKDSPAWETLAGATRPRTPLVQVAVTLTRLVEQGNYTPQLFPDLMQDDEQMGRAGDEKLRRLDATLDQLRARYGRNVVYLGAAQEARDSAPMRISFTHIPDMGLERDD